MSASAFDWLVVTAAIFAAVAVAATIAAIIESRMEWKREREQRLPEPEWRARVVRRWRVPE
jgi:uncharacterized membrane protein YraQ (UPF0718 family)